MTDTTTISALFRRYFNILQGDDDNSNSNSTSNNQPRQRRGGVVGGSVSAIQAQLSRALGVGSSSPSSDPRVPRKKNARRMSDTGLARELHYLRSPDVGAIKTPKQSIESPKHQCYKSSPSTPPSSSMSPYRSSPNTPARRRRMSSNQYDTTAIKRGRRRNLHYNLGQHVTNRAQRHLTYPHHGQRAHRALTSHMLPNKVASVNSYDARVFCGKFNADGSRFMTASQDHRIKIYNTYSPRVQNAALSRRQLAWRPMKDVHCRHISWSIIDCDFSPSGDYVSASCVTASVHVQSTVHPRIVLLTPMLHACCVGSGCVQHMEQLHSACERYRRARHTRKLGPPSNSSQILCVFIEVQRGRLASFMWLLR